MWAHRQCSWNLRFRFNGGFRFSRRQRRARLGGAREAVAVGEQAVVPDFDETFWQNMQPEPADELRQREGHRLFPGIIGIIFVGERDGLRGRIEREQTAVRDANAMRVAGQIGQHRVRPGERPLGINHPVFSASLPHQLLKPFGWCQRLQATMELQLSGGVELAQAVAELAAKDFRQRPNGKEPVPCRCPPAVTIQPQATAGDDAVQVIMIEQGLTPRVQDGGNADLGIEVVATELQERGRHRIEQEVVKTGAVLLNQVVEFMRQREHEMEIGDGQEMFGLFVQPIITVGTLTGRTMTVPARMRHEVFFGALAALVIMSAQGGRAAGHNGAQNFPVVEGQTVFPRVLRHPASQNFRQSQ